VAKGAQRCVQRAPCKGPPLARRNFQALSKPPTTFATTTPNACHHPPGVQFFSRFVMPNPGIRDEATLNSCPLEPVGLFDRRPERLVKGGQLENFSVSRQIPEHWNLLAVEINWRSENLPEESLNFLAVLSQDWAL